MRQAAFVPIENGFRAKYDYCNLMFVVAGAVIEAVSGQRWEDFVQTRIFDRVGMSESVPLARLADPAKSALPHGRVGPPLRYQGAMTQIAIASGLMMPRFSPAMSSTVLPSRRWWSIEMGVTTATLPSATLVASHTPPRPTSTIATSTGASANTA